MKEKYIAEITNIINNLDEKQLLYIVAFLRKMFGVF